MSKSFFWYSTLGILPQERLANIKTQRATEFPGSSLNVQIDADLPSPAAALHSDWGSYPRMQTELNNKKQVFETLYQSLLQTQMDTVAADVAPTKKLCL